MDILTIPCDSAYQTKIVCEKVQDILIASGLSSEMYAPEGKDAQNEAQCQKNIMVI